MGEGMRPGTRPKDPPRTLPHEPVWLHLSLRVLVPSKNTQTSMLRELGQTFNPSACGVFHTETIIVTFLSNLCLTQSQLEYSMVTPIGFIDSCCKFDILLLNFLSVLQYSGWRPLLRRECDIRYGVEPVAGIWTCHQIQAGDNC